MLQNRTPKVQQSLEGEQQPSTSLQLSPSKGEADAKSKDLSQQHSHRSKWFPAPKHLFKWLLWGAVGTIIVSIIANALKPNPVLVQVATVKRGDLQVTVNARANAYVS